MRDDIFGFVSNLDTLAAVALGAVLATVGGIVASQIEARAERKRRARDSARFFGEVLASADTILHAASDSRKIGDPYGAVTLRMLRMVRSEFGVYERNRERLFDIPDPDLRAKIHLHALLVLSPLDGILDHSAEISLINAELGRLDDSDPTNDPSPKRTQDLRERLASHTAAREASFDAINRVSTKINAILEALKPLAKVDFSAFAKAAEI